MAYSNQTWTITSEVPTVLVIPFPYISQDHVYVEIDGVDFPLLATDWNTAQTISTARMGLVEGSVVYVYRDTPKEAMLVNYRAGADTTDVNLDSANEQLLYITQEQLDTLTDAMRLGSAGAWDAQGLVVGNGAAPVEPTDLATKAYTDSVTDAVADDADRAALAAAAALVSETNAAQSAIEAAQSATDADTSADEAYDAALAAAAARDAIPAAGDILVDADIGVAVQAYDQDILKAGTPDILTTFFGDAAQVHTGTSLVGLTVARNHIVWPLTANSVFNVHYANPSASGAEIPAGWTGTLVYHVYPNGYTLLLSSNYKFVDGLPDPDSAAGEVRIVVELFNGRQTIVSVQNVEA